ncbi:hypothetical protein KKG90_11565 [Candidatus Bipolaricaulota bacterium]|nr:hypothetical protein [Candidatus Bipolaricaulota bacterium]
MSATRWDGPRVAHGGALKKHCTTENGMDERVQRPVFEYRLDRFDVPCVDTTTAPGPNGVLSKREDESTVKAILKCVDVSVNKHDTFGIAVVGHYDCAGNPGDEARQNADTRHVVRFSRASYSDRNVIGLHVNDQWVVEEIEVAGF